MKEDGVRLVNIGAEDITGGNLKLILGMIWTLIRRYQIGSQSKLPPKRLMLSWCNAVLHPHMRVSNFSNDWNDGVALHGLLEYCRPGTCPTWFNMPKSDRIGNCQNAMRIGQELFKIPIVTKPEDFASHNLDELSGMTYISYFLAEGAPGFNATLNWVRLQVSPNPVDNFNRDWNNGFILSTLSRSLGARVPGWPTIDTDWEAAIQTAMDSSEEQLNVEPVIEANDMASEDVDHIGVMAYAAWHEASTRGAPRSRTPTPPPVPTPIVPLREPTPPPPPPLINPDIMVSIVENWKIDSTHTIKMDTSKLGPGQITASAHAPSGLEQVLKVSRLNENEHHADFTPMEKGCWEVDVRYNSSSVAGSPFLVNVYDPSLAKIARDYQVAEQTEPYVFEVDCVQVGIDKVDVYVIHDGAKYPHEMDKSAPEKTRVSFVPEAIGTYTVSVFCGGQEVPDSPFDVVAAEGSGPKAHVIGLTGAFVGRDSLFDVDTGGYSSGSLDVNIKGPSGRRLPVETSRHGTNMFNVQYTPQEPGDHVVDVIYADKPITGSPFIVQVKKPCVYVSNLNQVVYIGKKEIFQIDASEMRKGMLEIDSDLPVLNYDKLGNNTYQVTFVPRRVGKHDMVIKYNNEVVDGCPFQLDVRPGQA